MTRYIDQNRAAYRVEPICRTLEIAPSSYYAARSRPPSARSTREAMLKDVIIRVHRANFGVYGARKVWRALHRLGLDAGRDQVARLMKAVNLQGATREKTIRTTKPADLAARPADLVERTFAAAAPNRLWVADITYVWTIAGFAYTAFIVDVFSRRIVGWRTAASLRTDLALDALEMAVFARGQELPGLIHHSDRGVQYLAIRYTERLAEAGVVNSVGSKGDSYDNALAETVNGLYKTELIRRRKRWHSLEELELATAEWVHWWNESRLHSACGDVPPAEFEEAYHRQLAATVAA
jgi:putative transposase